MPGNSRRLEGWPVQSPRHGPPAAFVDIGVHKDGRVEDSQMADHFIKDANDVVKIGQNVQVTVT